MSLSTEDLQQKAKSDPIWGLLTPKKRAFLLEFLVDHDKIRAAQRAGGYTDYKTAATQANRWIKDKEIRKILRNLGDHSLVDGGLITNTEIKQVLSDIIRSSEVDPAARLKAIETFMKFRAAKTGGETENPSPGAALALERERLRKGNG